MSTSGYQAGFQSNQVVVSYAAESVYKQIPAVAFQSIRLTSESLAGTKTRKSPPELIATGEMPQNVTTQEQAGGSINIDLSFGTYDDWFAASLGGAFSTSLSIVGVAGDIALAVGGTITSTTANKFAAVTVGSWILISGFTNAVNNGVFRVVTKPSAMSITISAAYVNGTLAPFIAETPSGAAVQITTSTLINGTTETTFTIEKQFSSNIFLQYPGSWIQSFTLTGTTGDFINGSFTIMSGYEQSAVVTASTGAYVPAPTRRVMATMAAFGGIFWNDAPIAGFFDSFTLTASNDGSSMQYAVGTTQGVGFNGGLQKVTGQLKMYFNSLALYANFKSEAQGRLSIKMSDNVGNTYVFTVLNAALMNPNVVAGQQNTPVYATFTIEGNPLPTGGTIQIDRLLVA